MNNSFKDRYVEEALEIIASLEDTILSLEKEPENLQTVEEVFRAMHTLKGGGAMFGFNKIKDVTHELESIYDRIRNGKCKVSTALLNLTLGSIDYFKILLGVDENEVEKDYHEKLLEKIQELLNKGDCSGSEEMKLETRQEDKPENKSESKKTNSGEENDNNTGEITDQTVSESKPSYQVFFQPNKNIIKNGTDPLLLVEEIAQLGKSKVIPVTGKVKPLNEMVIDEIEISWYIIVNTENEEEIRDAFIFVEDDSKIEIKKIDEGDIFEQPNVLKNIEAAIKGDFSNFDPSTPKIQNDNITKEQEDMPEEDDLPGNAPVTDINIPDRTTQTETKTSQTKQSSANAISSIRISSEKVDELMNLVSELVTTQARLNLLAENETNPELTTVSENIQKLSRQLRDNAFDLSMVPLEKIITKFQRLTRDLSQQLNKDVIFETEGTDTELDKSIIENLSDPLLHIIRNSIDHGIEDAETRKKRKKPAKGKISLKAFYSGANVHIQISDDGAGIDPEAVKKKATEKGIISKDATLLNKDIFDLLFLPGFSTNNEVTDISGRGVGMDVVKQKISEIRGEVEIDSVLNVGTTITIKLPLTLSIIDGLLIKIDDTDYIIPLTVVNKIYPIKHSDLDNKFYNVIVLDDKQIPYFYLRKEFKIEQDAPEMEQVIVVEHNDKQFGLVVDKVVGEYQAVLKPLGKHYKKVQIFSGATILGDGSVALVMDTNHIISKHNKNSKIDK